LRKKDDCPASLELRKLYQIVPDKSSNALGLTRIIDESGEDYFTRLNISCPLNSLPTYRKLFNWPRKLFDSRPFAFIRG